jgi:hypothetical protein
MLSKKGIFKKAGALKQWIDGKMKSNGIGKKLFLFLPSKANFEVIRGAT